jgi:predicted unusual protein kinase regulating ubiquinone biosynthesis (AarF/ABC1/UbiB family)
MAQDLANLRALAAFLSATEIRFDLVSAVEELQRQIHLEFDFTRWAGRLGASMQGATVCTQWACGMLASHA